MTPVKDDAMRPKLGELLKQAVREGDDAWKQSMAGVTYMAASKGAQSYSAAALTANR